METQTPTNPKFNFKLKFSREALLVLLVALVTGVVGIFLGLSLGGQTYIYESSLPKVNTTQSGGQTSTTTVATSVASASTTSSVALSVFTNTNPDFTIKYPAGWTVNSSQSDWGNEQYGSSTTRVTKGNYEFTLQLSKGSFGPQRCFYPDMPDNGQPGTTYSDYKEITALDGKVYRRTTQPFSGNGYALLLWTCVKVDGGFTSGFSPMYAGLNGTAYTEEILAELDLMLINFHLGK